MVSDVVCGEYSDQLCAVHDQRTLAVARLHFLDNFTSQRSLLCFDIEREIKAADFLGTNGVLEIHPIQPFDVRTWAVNFCARTPNVKDLQLTDKIHAGSGMAPDWGVISLSFAASYVVEELVEVIVAGERYP